MIGWIVPWTMFYCFCTYPLWLSIVISGALIYAVWVCHTGDADNDDSHQSNVAIALRRLDICFASQHLFGTKFPGKENPNKLFLGMFTTGWLLATVIYFHSIIEYTGYLTVETVLFIMLNFVTDFLYLTLLRSDPGVIPLTLDNGLEV
jgi:hypothetical protein